MTYHSVQATLRHDVIETGFFPLRFGVLAFCGLFAGIGIVNPSFETPGVGAGDGSYVYLAGPVDGWTYNGGAGVSGNSSGFTNGNAPAPDGGQVLFLQNTGTASQTLSGFQSGYTYTLSFDMASRQNYGFDPTQVLQVTLGTQTLFSGLPFINSPNYEVETVSFTASGSQTLEFAGLDAGPDSTDFVDDVAISDVVSPTPEPGFYGLLALGLGGLVTVVDGAAFPKFPGGERTRG